MTQGFQGKRGTLVGDVFAFAVPTVLFLELESVGRLFASDLILLGALLPLLVSRGYQLAGRLPRTLLLLGLAWLVGQIATDIIHQTPFEDYARGWAKIAVFMCHFAALYLLLHDSRKRVVLYAVGLVVGGVLDFYLSPTEYAEGHPWKFGVGGPITWGMVLLATYTYTPRRDSHAWGSIGAAGLMSCLVASLSLYLALSPGDYGAEKLWWHALLAPGPLAVELAARHTSSSGGRRVSAALIGFAAFLNLYMGFRSLAGICFLTAVYVFVQSLERRPKHLPLRSILCIFLVIMGAGMAFLKGYEYAASKGFLGEQARQNYEWQASGDLGIFLGGRSEILVSLRAIADSPLLGHGSWAKDWHYAGMLIELKRELGYVVWGERDRENLISTHSHLFGAWVEAGILGGAFWLWILWIAARSLPVLYGTEDSVEPVIVFAGLLLVWDVLFSPFGAERRFITPYYIILLMMVLEGHRKGKLHVRDPLS